MFSKLPMYQRQGAVAFKKDLKNTLALSSYLQNPHQKFKSIHVAGTNGKGSTAHMLAAVLQAAGYRVGLYTSPHLKDFRERIKINGETISEAAVVAFVDTHKGFLSENGLSFFEMTVGLAFDYFAEQQVDFAVVEVGLGGRLDSTNIIKPLVSVITNIGYDHMNMLGTTLAEIAAEKAGVIKADTPVVISERQPEVWDVFVRVAKALKAPLICAEDEVDHTFLTDLRGWYQSKNSKGVIATIDVLREQKIDIEDKHIHDGLLNVVRYTGLLGRYQVIQEHPQVICDTAHNVEGLRMVMGQIAAEEFKTLHIVLGVVNDKNLAEIIPLFPTHARYYFCRPNIPRGLAVEILSTTAAEFGRRGASYSSVNEAFKAAVLAAHSEDLIYVGGSTFVVAEIV